MDEYRTQAEALCKALKKLTNNEDNLNNFESYLSYHFDIWLKQYANTPNGVISEIESFANMEV